MKRTVARGASVLIASIAIATVGGLRWIGGGSAAESSCACNGGVASAATRIDTARCECAVPSKDSWLPSERGAACMPFGRSLVCVCQAQDRCFSPRWADDLEPDWQTVLGETAWHRQCREAVGVEWPRVVREERHRFLIILRIGNQVQEGRGALGRRGDPPVRTSVARRVAPALIRGVVECTQRR